jgi:hypothetical protein
VADATRPYVRLDPGDNVVVLVRHVESGDRVAGLAGGPWTMAAHLEAGNKLAAVPIAIGERVIKLGVPIGRATQAIEPGAHVHTHNLRSDYIQLEPTEPHGTNAH